MADYYDRQGNAVPMMTWAKSLESDRKIERTTLPNGRWVSTVWLGLDHRFGSGPPLIFETMVFPSEGEWGELDCKRYATEAEARDGHVKMCAKWTVDQPEEDTE